MADFPTPACRMHNFAVRLCNNLCDDEGNISRVKVLQCMIQQFCFLFLTLSVLMSIKVDIRGWLLKSFIGRVLLPRYTSIKVNTHL